mmetsp:Transcript_2212/g.6544  ORF Transcript_2212/g.6544 Transcript_2212/m.6544 type:complete len:169 (-) Transcript_2212:32-538(-)|eukprot:CAMPEP_0117652000 /NCGR_PEP_ID=MMETSP0804-20121206/2395_1 /TAXON_ID=1074897 /ORGANISM="Tetraselmis astigmatica, Strain CCMP880" /LENGTH=168 /DNA_ID=CAMNT_0005458021 /DNA_START=449 /DNA_END=955 /DNA_ORIENTATION=+
MFRGAAVAKAGREGALGNRRKHARKRGQMSDADMDFIEEVWAKYDVNDDGTIAEKEVEALMTEINEDIPPSKKEVKMLIKVADADKSGTINKAELKKLVATWFVMAEDKNRRVNIKNIRREVTQALHGCMHDDNTKATIVKYPGEEAVQYWKNTQETMHQNYSKPIDT